MRFWVCCLDFRAWRARFKRSAHETAYGQLAGGGSLLGFMCRVLESKIFASATRNRHRSARAKRVVRVS